MQLSENNASTKEWNSSESCQKSSFTWATWNAFCPPSPFPALPDLDYLNRDVDPCENFYEYTCGNFKNVHPRPDGEEIWDHFTIEQQKLHDLMLGERFQVYL